MESIPPRPGIYAIVNQVNQHRYVGSAVNLLQRKRDHFKGLKAGNHRNDHLQKAYALYGASHFSFEVIELVEHANELLSREQHYIDTLHPEYNIAQTAGSSLGVKRTPEYVEKMRATKTGKKLSPEHVATMSAVRRGKKQSPEHVTKRTESRVRSGWKPTPEHMAKATEAARMVNTGMKRPPETTMKGKHQSPEHVAKRMANRHNQKLSPEQSANMTEAARMVNTGKKRPPEGRAKISATKRAKKLAQQKALQPPLF